MANTALVPRAGSARRGGRAPALTRTLTPAPRKKRSRLSAAQRQRRQEHEADQSAIYNLTLDVNDLRQQLRALEERRALHATRLLAARQRFQDQAVGAAALFFSVFRTGFRAFSARELAFLRVHVAPDVAFASSRGLDAFLDQWRRYKVLFRQGAFRISTIRVLANLDAPPDDNDGASGGGADASHGAAESEALARVDAPRGCVLECLGDFDAHLTRAAIDVVFPHVAAQSPALAARLEDAAVAVPTRTLVYVDERGRIVDYDAHADFFAALSNLRGLHPADVIRVMADARIESSGSLVPPPPEPDSSVVSDVTDEADEDKAGEAKEAEAKEAEGEKAEGEKAEETKETDADSSAGRRGVKRHSVAYLLS